MTKHTFKGNTNKLIGLLGLSNRVLPIDSVFYNISYELVKDNYGNYKNFFISNNDDVNYKPD